MISMTDIASTESPGYFILQEIGAAVGQSMNRTVNERVCTHFHLIVSYVELDGGGEPLPLCFSGLRFHGGFPPTAAPGDEPNPWSYRVAVVCYPPRRMLDGTGRIALSTFPDGELMTLPPEMVLPR